MCRQGGTKQSLLVKSPLWVPLPLPGPANICLLNICFSISVSIAFLLFDIPNRYPQYSPLSLAEVGIEAEGSGHLYELLSFPGFLPCIHVIKPLFGLLLLICLLPVQFLDQPEPKRVEEHCFLPDNPLGHRCITAVPGGCWF